MRCTLHPHAKRETLMTFKAKLDTMLSYPLQTSLFVALYSLLLFLPLIRPPIVLSIILVTALVYLSMFFGALFSRDRSPD